MGFFILIFKVIFQVFICGSQRSQRMDGSVIKRMILTEGKTDFIMKPRFQRQIPGKKRESIYIKVRTPAE